MWLFIVLSLASIGMCSFILWEHHQRQREMTARFAAQDAVFQRQFAESMGIIDGATPESCAQCKAAEGLSGTDIMLVSDGTHTHVHKNQFKGVTTSGEFTIDMGAAYTGAGCDLTFRGGE